MEVQKQIGSQSQVEASSPQLQIASENYSHTREQILVNNSKRKNNYYPTKKNKGNFERSVDGKLQGTNPEFIDIFKGATNAS